MVSGGALHGGAGMGINRGDTGRPASSALDGSASQSSAVAALKTWSSKALGTVLRRVTSAEARAGDAAAVSVQGGSGLEGALARRVGKLRRARDALRSAADAIHEAILDLDLDLGVGVGMVSTNRNGNEGSTATQSGAGAGAGAGAGVLHPGRGGASHDSADSGVQIRSRLKFDSSDRGAASLHGGAGLWAVEVARQCCAEQWAAVHAAYVKAAGV